MTMGQHRLPGFQTVVVGHDGTAASDAALALARQLAADDATLLVARVVAAPRLALAHGHDHGDLEHAEGELAALDLRATGAQRVATRALAGRSVTRALSALAEEEGADLIVVGSGRRPGDYREHKVLGLRLVQSAPCAVAMAATEGHEEIRHIGVAYDGSPEAELALDAAYDVAQRLHAAVTLYLAILPDLSAALGGQLIHRDAGALLDAAAERAPEGVNPETIVATGWASSAIARRAEQVDLLVLGSRRHSALLHTLAGSTSRAVAVELGNAMLITPRGALSHATEAVVGADATPRDGADNRA
jgi:nucleotide-binding universal stress UspA family protein